MVISIPVDVLAAPFNGKVDREKVNNKTNTLGESHLEMYNYADISTSSSSSVIPSGTMKYTERNLGLPTKTTMSPVNATEPSYLYNSNSSVPGTKTNGTITKVSPQIRGADIYNVKNWTGTLDPSPQVLGAVKEQLSKGLNIDLAGNTNDSLVLTTQPGGSLPSIATRSNDSSPSLEMPAGTVAITAQLKDAAIALVRPNGAQTIAPLVNKAAITMSKPNSLPSNLVNGFPGTMTHSAPSGAHAINPLSVNLSSTATQPNGVPVSLSNLYYLGNLSIDATQSETNDSVLWVCLIDTGVAGTYDNLALSINDEVFNEGALGDSLVDWGAPPGGNANDELIIASGDLTLGNVNAPLYTVSFSADPTAGTDDASIQSKEWYTGNFNVDADSDMAVDDTVYFSVYDENSNGIFESADLSLGDQTFGEGNLTNGTLVVGDDEVLNGTGGMGGKYGPDAYGYTWTDSAPYDWIEINASGTNASLDDDDYTYVSLGFNFTYYGDTFNNTTICSNGWISFNDTFNNDFRWFPDLVPNATDDYYGPLCVLCEDLDPSMYGSVYYGTFGSAPHRYFIVEYSNIQHYDGSETMNAEMILYESSNYIKYQWMNITILDGVNEMRAVGIEKSDNGTIGIGNGANGTLYINGSNIQNGTAYEFFPPGTMSTKTEVRIGPYAYEVLRSADPSVTLNDLNITSIEWYKSSVPFDGSASGQPRDRLNYAIADTNSDGIFEKLYLSFNQTFGVGNLANDIVNLTDGESYDWAQMPRTLTIGPSLAFSIEFSGDPAVNVTNLRITALRWYWGDFLVDADAGGLANDQFNYVLTDMNSDGAYEVIDLSYGDLNFGQGNMADNIVVANNDERYQGQASVRLGNIIIFTISTNGAPTGGIDDLSVANDFTYKGNITFDTDQDGTMNEDLYFVISDANSNGIYDTLDLSFDPIYGEGNVNDGLMTVKPANDERIVQDSDVQLGKGMNFNISFDKDPMKDTSDIRIKVTVWFEGAFKIDASKTGKANDKLYYVMSDTNSDGFVDTLDLSLGNEVFGEGTLNDGILASGNDERFTKEGTVTIGPLQFAVNFTGSPMGVKKDAWLKNLDLYTGSFKIDMGIDGKALDEVDFVMSDSDADGLYDTLDLSLGDKVFRQDLAHDGYVDMDNNDEIMASPGDVRIGPFVYNITFVWDPFSTVQAVKLTSKQWYLGNFILDSNGDGAANEIVYFVLSDLDSNGVYDMMDLSMADKTFGQGDLGDKNLTAGNDERITVTTVLGIGTQRMEARFSQSPNQNIDRGFLTNLRWYTGTFVGSGWTIYYAVCDKNSDGLYDAMELSPTGVFGLGDNGDGYMQEGNDEVVKNGSSVVRGTYHYMVFLNTTMGGPRDAGLKGTEWRIGKWKVEGMSRSVAVSDANSDGVFDTIHVDLNDDGSYDGPTDLVGGMDGFKGALTLRYAVASSNDDGTQIEVVPVNATTGTTNGWMVGLASVDNIGVGLALSDRDGNNIFETLDMDVDSNGVLDFRGLTETNNVTAIVHGKGYRVIKVATDGTLVKLLAFTDAVVGSAVDRSITGTLYFGKASEASIGADLNDDGKLKGDLVAMVVDVSTAGPVSDRFALYLDTNLNGDLSDEKPLMLGSVFDMGSAQWKVDNIANDRKEVGLMKTSGPAATATTGPDGTFSMTPPDGSYWFRTFSPTTGWGYRVFEDTNGHKGYKLSGAGITGKEVVLLQSATSIAGVVTDMMTGQPIKGVKVEVYNSDGKKVVSTLTLDDGSYLLGVQRNIVISVVFTKDGYQTDDGTKANGTWHGMAVGSGRSDVNVALMPVPAPDVLSFEAPAEGSVVGGTVHVKVKVTDTIKVDKVLMTANNGLTWTAMAPAGSNEFTYSWDTKQGPDSVYKLTARATNDNGLRVDKSLSVKVDNGGPMVTFDTAPQQYGNVEISVKANDQFSDVKSVEVRIDGGAWKTMSKGSGGYYYIWTSGPFDSGKHTYEVRATDSRGNVAVYKSTLNVDNTWMLLLIVMVILLVVLAVVVVRRRKAPKDPAAALKAPKEGAR
jgi:hypothetical protein